MLLENLEWIDLNAKINFTKKFILFEMKQLKRACFRMINNNEIIFINQQVKMSKEYIAKVKYLRRENLTNLEITHIPLSNEDTDNLIKSIIIFGNIKILSLFIEKPSWIIIILNWWKLVNQIISISLRVTGIINWSQKYEIELEINKLKCQDVRVNIVAPNLI